MWEKVRVDGKRKLKLNAVPTIFSFTKPMAPRKLPKQRSAPQESADVSVPGPSSGEPQLSKGAMLLMASSSSASFSSDFSVIESPDTSGTEMLVARREKYISDITIKNNNLKKKLRAAQKKVKRLQVKLSAETFLNKETKSFKLLSGVFNADQIYALDHNVKYKKWSNETVKKALTLKFSCGNNGYQQLLKEKIPLPSLRTLSRRLESLKFSPGILDEVFEFLALKVSGMSSHEKNCAITLDEMAITSSNIFDPSSKQYIGDVTLPQHKGIAKNALVVMLGGITSRWKQTIAYHFTGMYINKMM